MNVRRHLAIVLAVTCVTAWFSYAYFHIDEYFQIIELTRIKLPPMATAVGPEVLSWEGRAHMRPWLQSFVYWVFARVFAALGMRELFSFACVFRFVTGFANVAALGLFLRTTLPWLASDEEKRLHLRVTTLAGFLPYLFVRTSSESASMAALTAGFALLFEGSREGDAWNLPALAKKARMLGVGFLFGCAFEFRFQTILVALGIAAWLFVVGKARPSSLVLPLVGGVLALAAGALADRWGYGVWCFPPWTYFQANILEGAAGFYGTAPPFAYFWMLPANVFFPVVLAGLLLAVLAWIRKPKHPLTWATLPFFVVHNLLSHKEERFLFPIAVLMIGLVVISMAEEPARLGRLAAWLRARTNLRRLLAGWSFAGMAFLAFVPLGWNHNVRFTRFILENIGEELHATALPEVNLALPAFHPRVYDVDKASPEDLAKRIDAGTAKPWVIADRPTLEGTPLAERTTLAFSELPTYRHPELSRDVLKWVDVYNAHVASPLRALRFRTIYAVSPRQAVSN